MAERSCDLAPFQYQFLANLAIEWTRQLQSTAAGRELIEKKKQELRERAEKGATA